VRPGVWGLAPIKEERGLGGAALARLKGGSTATGVLGIQLAKLLGCRVVTCSPRNFGYVKSLGVKTAFDYKSPTAVADIKELINGQLQHAWDCIGSTESAKLYVSADEGGAYASLNTVNDSVIHKVNPNFRNTSTLAYTIFEKRFEKFGVTPAIPKDYDFGKKFWEYTRGLLADGKIKTARLDVDRGGKGLEGVVIGLRELKENKVRGEKLVYTP
jgi:NADPH:quinone reductase-like Zn-dependent oxidoreductase